MRDGREPPNPPVPPEQHPLHGFVAATRRAGLRVPDWAWPYLYNEARWELLHGPRDPGVGRAVRRLLQSR